MIVGRVISHESKFSPNHLEFIFQVIKGYEPRVGDYVRVRTTSSEARFLIGQVTLAHAGNMYLDNPKIASMYLDSPGAPQGYGLYNLDNWECGVARIVGTVTEGIIEFSGYAPKPGDEVELLDPGQTRQSLGIPDSGLFIGTGNTSQGEYKVNLIPTETLSHNILISGRIGSGKTYAGGIFIEEFLEQGIPVVAVDPHGELGSLAVPNDDKEQLTSLQQLGDKVKGYRTCHLAPPSFAKGDVLPFAVPIGLLTTEELINIIDERGEMGGRQIALLAIAMEKARRQRNGPNYTVNDVANQIRLLAKKNEQDRLAGILYRLQNLNRLDIFNPKYATDPADLVKEGTATIITLPGVSDSIQRAVVAVLARQLLKARMANKVPRFLLYVDEGHMFAPARVSVPSKGPLIRFAKECRKFGAGLCMVSQQPADIADEIRSQCHTRIFLQLDSQTDMQYVRSSITDHWKDLIEMVPFFPPGKAILRAKTFRFPLLIQMRPRRSKHKGIAGDGETMQHEVAPSEGYQDSGEENLLDALFEENEEKLKEEKKDKDSGQRTLPMQFGG